MGATRNYLAFDLGAESGRGVLGRFDGQRIELEVVHRFANTPVPLGGTLHWDTPYQFGQLLEALGVCARDHTADLAGVGVDTWGVDFGLLGHDGTLVGLPVHYRDGRTDGVMEKAFEVLGRQHIFARTGIQFMQFNTLFQLYAMKLAGAPQLDVAARLLFTPDLFNYWFTGRQVSEESIASTSQFWDPRAGAWALDLLEGLGLPTDILPEVVAPGSVVGELRADLAAAAGVGALPVISPGSHDTASAVAAVPAVGDDHVYISSGTWSLMGMESPEPIIDQRTLALNFTNEGGVCGRIRFLKNIMGLWLVQQTRRSYQRAGEDLSYDALTAAAGAAPPFAAVLDPDDSRFLLPPDMPTAIADYCQATGQAVPEGVGGLVRTALESLALRYRWVVDNLQELRGRAIDTINIVGGGTQNRLLCQLTADCTGLPVVAGPIEATATGNLLMQAMATGEIGSLDELRAVVRASFDLVTYEPAISQRGAWDDAYARFQGLLGASGGDDE